MVSNSDDRIDPANLTPTAELILDVLAARWRLGETSWRFPARLQADIRALEHLGAATGQAGKRDGTVTVSLTDAGRDHVINPQYRPPLADRTARRDVEVRPDPVEQPDAYYAT